MTIKDKAIQFRNLSKNINKVATDWLVSNSGDIIDGLREMWDEGEAANGQMPEYSQQWYPEWKAKKNLSSGKSEYRYDIQLSHNTKDLMSARRSGTNGVQIFSSSKNARKITALVESKGLIMWQMNYPTQVEFIKKNKEDFQKRIKNELK
jgi:hypothetical protein